MANSVTYYWIRHYCQNPPLVRPSPINDACGTISKLILCDDNGRPASIMSLGAISEKIAGAHLNFRVALLLSIFRSVITRKEVQVEFNIRLFTLKNFHNLSASIFPSAANSSVTGVSTGRLRLFLPDSCLLRLEGSLRPSIRHLNDSPVLVKHYSINFGLGTIKQLPGARAKGASWA